jgi:hypothetical protein
MVSENMILIPQQIKVVTNYLSHIFTRGNPSSTFFRDQQSVVGEHQTPLLDLV